MVLVVSCLALLVLIIVGFVILVGNDVVMVLLPDLVKVRLILLWMSCCVSFVILLSLGVLCFAGTLPLRYCAARFAHTTPTWQLPGTGYVERLIASHSGAGDCGSEVLELGVHLVSRSGHVQKRSRLNRKTPAHLVGGIGSFSSTRLEEVASGWFSWFFIA